MTDLRLSSLRKLALLAALAMLCIALAPGMTQWLRSSQGGSVWNEICSSSTGFRFRIAQGDTATAATVASADRSAQVPLSTSESMTDHHCHWCTHLGAWPPLEVQLALAPATAAVRPERFYSAPHAVFAWASAQPRGPPRLV